MKRQYQIIICYAGTYSKLMGTMKAVPNKLVRTIDAVKASKN